MAAIAGSIFQTTFAAISFAGAGYLFKAFDKNGYEAEMKRHNRALEELTIELKKSSMRMRLSNMIGYKSLDNSYQTLIKTLWKLIKH